MTVPVTAAIMIGAVLCVLAGTICAIFMHRNSYWTAGELSCYAAYVLFVFLIWAVCITYIGTKS